MSDVVARCFREGEWNADELANLAERLNEDNERLKAELAQAKEANSRLQERRNEIELQLSQARSRLRSDYVQLKKELAQAKRLLRNIVSNLHCNEDIDQELYDAAEFLNGTSGRTPDRPAITN